MRRGVVKVGLMILAVVLGLLVVIEIGLRVVFGFGNPLIYVADQDIGYLLAPNQKTRRFGNRIEINEYSMRCGRITPEGQPQRLRVLLLGDSIANGAWWTDQEATISALMRQQMLSRLPQLSGLSTWEDVEVLNASANSWGPPNQFAYLKRFGTFASQAMVLLINTDDLFSKAPSSAGVGRDRNYPNQKPPFALWEVAQRYLLPSAAVPVPSSPEIPDPVGFNLDKIRDIRAIASQTQMPFILAMTPLLREIGEPGPRDYEVRARQRLKDFTETEGIVYIDFLPIFNATPQPQNLYRDHIHVKPEGNQLISDRLTQTLLNEMK